MWSGRYACVANAHNMNAIITFFYATIEEQKKNNVLPTRSNLLSFPISTCQLRQFQKKSDNRVWANWKVYFVSHNSNDKKIHFTWKSREKNGHNRITSSVCIQNCMNCKNIISKVLFSVCFDLFIFLENDISIIIVKIYRMVFSFER